MRLLVAVVVAASLFVGCAKKKSEDKAPPASTEPVTGGTPPGAPQPAQGSAAIDPMTKPDTKGATPADEGGELERKMRTPADDGGEDKKPVPADDGGEAVRTACTKSADCPATFDCCNAFCVKQGTAKHAIECKLPEGKL